MFPAAENPARLPRSPFAILISTAGARACLAGQPDRERPTGQGNPNQGIHRASISGALPFSLTPTSNVMSALTSIAIAPE